MVERILRSGDIDGGYVSKDRMLEGAIAHRILQKSNMERYPDYQSEVSLSETLDFEGVEYKLEGRADGIFKEDGVVTIDEIKTTSISIHLVTEDYEIAHWAQAKCYGYIYAVQNNLSQIAVQLTYYNIESKETKSFLNNYDLQDLRDYIYGLISKYARWANFSLQWEQRRNKTIKSLEFPFENYRKGQRALAVGAYKAIINGIKLYAQAPTGTGKTMSCLFPAIKAMGEERISKIFYLTAKTITRQVAQEAVEKLKPQGLDFKTITLTAKDKICFCEKTICKPDYCSYAKGHYDRVDEAVFDLVNSEDDFTRQVIEEYAEKHKVCPFEFSLDVSLMADCIICDYNYVFDPRAYLRRFFSTGMDEYVFLIDEAHNLVDRSREMFSSQLLKSDLYNIKKEFKGRNKSLDKVLKEINKYFIDLRKKADKDGYLIFKDRPDDFLKLVDKYISVCEEMLKEDKALGEEGDFLQQYFNVLGFAAISELYDNSFVTFVESSGNQVCIKLFCLDPSNLLRESLKRGKSAVLFSATLSPLDYFKNILGGDEEDKTLSLDSPFEQKNFCLLAADRVSTKYHDRQASKTEIVDLINTFVSAEKGNYMVYFPSYKYMNDVYLEFNERFPDINSVEQESNMSEEGREIFLESFKENPDETHVSFCVLGGIFSEGIDLVGNRLIGTVIVSVGLPQLNVQQNIIKDHFNEKNGKGYEYSYMYPGMNKVLQAAGRVIRSEEDKGAVLLIDERYGHRNYKKLFPKHWHRCKYIDDKNELTKVLKEFWGI
nr:ATP-dependent DNA helicase [Alkalibacter mobilis]